MCVIPCDSKKPCTLTNATFGCPSTNEFLEQIDEDHCCCPCPTGKAKREGEPLSIHCNESDEESEMKPSPSSTIDQPAMENTSPPTTASTTSTLVARSSTTATNPITEAASTPSHNIKNSTQNTTEETTSSGTTEAPHSQTLIGIPIGLFILAVFAIVIVIVIVIIVLICCKKRIKSCCCCCTNSVRGPESGPPGRPPNPNVENGAGQLEMSHLIDRESSPSNPGTRNGTQPHRNGSSYHDSSV